MSQDDSDTDFIHETEETVHEECAHFYGECCHMSALCCMTACRADGKPGPKQRRCAAWCRSRCGCVALCCNKTCCVPRQFCKTCATSFCILLGIVVVSTVIALLVGYKYPLTPSAPLTRADNADLCGDLNLLTSTYYCNATAYNSSYILPDGFITGCVPGSECHSHLHNFPCDFGTTGRVVLTKPDPIANPFLYNVVFRGTAEKDQWINNLDWSPIPWMARERVDVDTAPVLSKGFFREYRLVGPGVLARLSQEVGMLRAWRLGTSPQSRLSLAKGSSEFTAHNVTLRISGHSLGTMLATMFALDAQDAGYNVERVLLVSPPRLGHQRMANLLTDRLADRTLVMFNSLDYVPDGPPLLSGFHVPSFRSIMVTYPDRCQLCLRSLFLDWPWGEGCTKICGDAKPSIAYYDPADVRSVLNSFGMTLSRIAQSKVDFDGQWRRHQSSGFADIVCPAANMTASPWPEKLDETKYQSYAGVVWKAW